MSDLKWKTEKRKIKDLKLFDGNPRKMSEKQAEQLLKSLQKYNYVELITIDQNNRVIAGNMRVQALKKLGCDNEEIEVRVPSRPLTEEEARGYLLTSNKVVGDWDYDLLANFDEELLRNVGFDDIEITKLIDGFWEKEDIEIEETEKLENKLNIKYGDIYKLGDSYLICGDAKDSKIYENLLNQEKVDMMFADPPYELKENNWFDIAKNYVNGSIFVMYNDKEQVKLCYKNMDIFKNFFIVDFNIAIVINKKRAAQGHTLISYFSNAKNKFLNKNDCFETIIKYDKLKQMKNEANKYTKNIDLFEKFLLHYTKVNDKVLDIFSGLGTMLLLCEKNKRKCYSIELSPEYCNFIIENYEKNFGKKAKKL